MAQRVFNEIDVHVQLAHPAILRLFAFFEDDTHVYLVMELCRHGELYRYLQRRRQASDPPGSLGRLSEAEARGVMMQVVNGLMYLHGLGIIHRDLKLSNLLLSKDYDTVRFVTERNNNDAVENRRLWTGRKAARSRAWRAKDNVRHTQLHLTVRHRIQGLS
jgi:serine/threonine protein kinase